MFSISLLIIAAAIVYMVEAYIHTYYAVEYMHGTPLFFVLLAQYGVPVLFLLLCAHIIYKQIEKKRKKAERHRHADRIQRREIPDANQCCSQNENHLLGTGRPDAVSSQTVRTEDGYSIQHDAGQQDFR